MYTPVHIADWNIYDVFTNSDNQLIVVQPQEDTIPLFVIQDDKQIPLRYVACSHKHTNVYVLDAFEGDSVTLERNGIRRAVSVSHYPNLDGRLIMSTKVLNEDKFIVQWIEFYLMMGVEHFVIYDNKNTPVLRPYDPPHEKTSDLPSLLKDYIQRGLVILINWPYPHILEKSGISGQSTQQTHSIWAFRNAKWIGLFDVDEYLNPQGCCERLEHIIDCALLEMGTEHKDIGGIRVFQRRFFNGLLMPTHGHRFFYIGTCAIQNDHRNGWKQFVNPRNVNTYCVHEITNGVNYATMPNEVMHFNHYYFLNKAGRGMDRTLYRDYSLLRFLNYMRYIGVPIDD
jgi:hypothetical protein